MDSLYYLNGGFDLVLGGQDTGRYTALLKEMTLWFMLYVRSKDYCVVTADGIPLNYYEYIASTGLETGTLISGDTGPEQLQGRA